MVCRAFIEHDDYQKGPGSNSNWGLIGRQPRHEFPGVLYASLPLKPIMTVAGLRRRKAH
jgi:hypothetical protein